VLPRRSMIAPVDSFSLRVRVPQQAIANLIEKTLPFLPCSSKVLYPRFSKFPGIHPSLSKKEGT